MECEEYRRSRMRLGLSTKGLADLMGMGMHGGRSIRRWESGQVPIPNWAILIMKILTTKTIPDLEPFKRYASRKKSEGKINEKQMDSGE